MPTLQLPSRLTIRVVGRKPAKKERAGQRFGRGTFLVLGAVAALLYLHVAGEPRIGLSARSLQFPPTAKGSTSEGASVLVTNSGFDPLHIGGLQLRDEAAADFAFTSDCGGSALAPQHSCLVTITMTPSAPGERRAELVIPNDSDESAPSVTLTGEGRVPPVPDITPAPLSLHFEQPVNVESTVPVVLSNTGAVPVDIGAVTLKAPAEFSRNTACEHATLAVSGTCSVEVTFTPTRAGQSAGELTIDYAPGQEVTIPITAIATPESAPPTTQTEAQGRSDVEPKALTFRLEPGRSSGAQPVTVANIGGGAIRLMDVAITKGANNFAVHNPCTSEIYPGKPCTLHVDFTGKTAGRYEGILLISASDSTFPVSLTAEVTSPGIPVADVNPKRMVVSPAGTTASNSLAALFVTPRDVVYVRNAGNAPLEFTKIAFEPAGEFSVSREGLKAPCGKGQLAPGQTCEMRIVFHPNDGGGRASLLIFDNAESSPQRVALYGQERVAIRGQLQVESYNPDFGRVPVGTYSVRGVRMAAATPSQRIVLRNAGSGNLGITQIKPPSDTSYAVKADCPRTLAPSATCVILVTFQPTTVGLHPANVVIENDGSTGDATLSFQGEGINPYSKIRVSKIPQAVEATPVPR
jgi:hypothetical protein